ncbi:DnaJ domain-containing protein [Xylaria intraflava]|nr:DnaJ domain-containing protein [Xylaria intraflava]
MEDLYALLGTYPTATKAELTSAYRRMALLHHPDKNPNDVEGATARFQKITRVYELLGDETQRRRYDAYRQANMRNDDHSSNPPDVAEGDHYRADDAEGDADNVSSVADTLDAWMGALFRAMDQLDLEYDRRLQERMARERRYREQEQEQGRWTAEQILRTRHGERLEEVQR